MLCCNFQIILKTWNKPWSPEASYNYLLSLFICINSTKFFYKEIPTEDHFVSFIPPKRYKAMNNNHINGKRKNPTTYMVREATH